jgi:peroxisomal 3,2-trans-enoyl-CoA isomerase
MGHQKAAALFLAGDRISARKAETLGLISEILSKVDFIQKVIEIEIRIANSPPGALRATKKLMRDPVRQDLLDANDRECTLILKERHGSEEYQEAIKQFRIEQQIKQQSKSRL